MEHRVAFFETDAMRIVHHANYVRYFELARIAWLDRFDQPYKLYADAGLHFATTRIEASYHRSARFDDRIEIATWLEWVRGASLAMAYRIECDGCLLVSGRSEHACVDDEGRVRRIPRERRDGLARSAAVAEPDPAA